MKRLLLILLTLSIVPPAHSVVIYTYTGNPFTVTFQDATGIYSLSDFVTATLQVNNPIVQAPNTTVDASLLPGFSLSMSDETRTLGFGDTTDEARFEFDAAGSLVGWDVRKEGVSGPDFIETHTRISFTDQSAQIGSNGIQAQAWNHSIGSWAGFSTEGHAAPEPATLALLGLGLAGIAFSKRKAPVSRTRLS